jgi:lipoprotein-anchoring transpeptidase ErfK/SrfK
MDFRSASIIATLLIGLGGPGGQAFAQYYPYPVSPGPPRGSPPPIDADQGLRDTATLSPEVRPETGPTKELPPQFRRTLTDYYTTEPTSTIVIDTLNTYLYLVLGNGKALRYGIGVGREGFTLVWHRKGFQAGGMARLEPTGANDRAPTLSAALYGWRRGQSPRGACALPG